MTRGLVFTLVGFLFLTLLGPLQRLFGLELVVLDVPLIIVLYLALAGRLGYGRPVQRWSFLSGSIDTVAAGTSFVLGYLADVLGGGPKGIHCLTLVIIYLISLLAARHVYLAGSLAVIVVSFVGSVLASLLALAIRWLIGVPPSWHTLGVIASQALLCAAVAPLLMRLFRTIDAKLSGDSAERGSLCR